MRQWPLIKRVPEMSIFSRNKTIQNQISSFHFLNLWQRWLQMKSIRAMKAQIMIIPIITRNIMKEGQLFPVLRAASLLHRSSRQHFTVTLYILRMWIKVAGLDSCCLFPSEWQESGPFLDKHRLAVSDSGVNILLHNLVTTLMTRDTC